MMKKLIYIAGGNVSVLESQVLELLKFYHIKGIPLALIMGYRNTNEKGEIEKKLSNYSFLDVVWFKSYPTYQIFEFLTIRNIFSAVKKVRLGKFIFSCKKRASWLPYKKNGYRSKT